MEVFDIKEKHKATSRPQNSHWEPLLKKKGLRKLEVSSGNLLNFAIFIDVNILECILDYF